MPLPANYRIENQQNKIQLRPKVVPPLASSSSLYGGSGANINRGTPSPIMGYRALAATAAAAAAAAVRTNGRNTYSHMPRSRQYQNVQSIVARAWKP